MRPTDENQHGSTRPNLFSGARRRISEDNNLLARLERDSARQASGNRSRAAWYVAAAMLVLLLLAVVGYMAYENANMVRVLPVAQPSIGPDAAIANAAARSGDKAAMPDLPSNLPVQRNAPSYAGAPAPARDDAGPLPPLVLLHANDTDAVKPALPERLAEASKTGMSLVVPAPAPVRKIVRPVLSGLMSTEPPPISSTLASPTAPRPPASTRTRKSAPARVMAEAPVDTDVALLSAIIIHASSHADERAQLASAAMCARVPEKRCAGRPSAQP